MTLEMAKTHTSTVSREDLLAAHRAFWEGKGLLVRTKPHVPVRDVHVKVANRGVATEDVYLEPDMLNPVDFLGERATEQPAAGAAAEWPTEGDVLKIRGPFKIPWTEAIMGCAVKLVPRSGASWSESCLVELTGLERLRLRPDNPWLRKLVDFTRTLVQHSDGHYFVTHTTMRGPVDMADAMLGTQRLCLALMDEPEKVRALLEICTEAFIETARAQWAVIPPTEGGHVSRYGIWAPGQVTRTQADAASMLSPQLYRDVILPYDLEVLRAFDYTIMHVHSGYLHVAEPFLDEEVPSALQVGFDDPPFGPPVKELLPALKRILRHKPLVFHGVVSREDLKVLSGELPPDGLLLDLFIKGPPEDYEPAR